MMEIGCFISSHGFGHAMRMTAVLEELKIFRLDIHPHIFTTVPRHLFTPPLDDFTYHPLLTDIGLAQKSVFEEDIDTTVEQLNKLLPYDETLITQLARKCEAFSYILCDISPMGIAVARKAGIPSILVENFTWDWIYAPYINDNPQLQVHAEYLRDLFRSATFHIQTEPLCLPGNADLHCGPISRKIRESPEVIRSRIGCDDRKTILISMGGIEFSAPIPTTLPALSHYQFIFAGQKISDKIHENVFLLDRATSIYHPDLINSVDLLICKSGYSTIAECYQADVSIGCVSRATFPESRVMDTFVKDSLNGRIYSEQEFVSEVWLEELDQLLARTRTARIEKNGAQVVAKFLAHHL